MLPLPDHSVLPPPASRLLKVIDALAVSPLTAASYQWFGLASHMCDLKLAPLFGAVMISKKAWNRIPDSLKADLLAAAGKIANQMEKEVEQADTRAITIMKRYGLQVNPVPEHVEKEWRIVMESAYQHLLGASFEKESFDRVMTRLQEHRNNNSQ
jgi:TRAP-type C4-dicarboxylate transport system substrate-binding protein